MLPYFPVVSFATDRSRIWRSSWIRRRRTWRLWRPSQPRQEALWPWYTPLVHQKSFFVCMMMFLIMSLIWSLHWCMPLGTCMFISLLCARDAMKNIWHWRMMLHVCHDPLGVAFFQKTHWVPPMPVGDVELGHHLRKKWCTGASICVWKWWIRFKVWLLSQPNMCSHSSPYGIGHCQLPSPVLAWCPHY